MYKIINSPAMSCPYEYEDYEAIMSFLDGFKEGLYVKGLRNIECKSSVKEELGGIYSIFGYTNGIGISYKFTIEYKK